MKNIPIILSFLCTNLVWCSESNATEEKLVLDRRPGQILVLTETGLAKAKSLQNSYDQQPKRERINLTNILNSTETGYDDDLTEDPELAEAIRLSLLEGKSSETTPSPKLLEIKLQTLEPSDLPDSSLTKEEDDPFFKLALSNSLQEHEIQQSRIADDKEFVEKRQAEKRKAEAKKELDEVREIRSAQKESLFSRIDELGTEKDRLTVELSHLTKDSEPTKEQKQNKKLIEQQLERLSKTRDSLYEEFVTFRPLDNQIHEEIIHLIQGGDPRDLPWKQELSLIHQGEASSLSPSLQSSLPEIPSSALPNLNNKSPKDSGSSDKF